MENLFWSELKHLFTYSPIHLFSAPPCLEIKSKIGKLVLVGVKTPIHLFTIHLFTFFLLLLFFEEKIKEEVQGTSTKRVTNTPSCMVAIRQNKGYQLKSDALWKQNRKMENLFWSELKHLFTYSPIHFHLLAGSLSIPFSFYPLLEKGE